MYKFCPTQIKYPFLNLISNLSTKDLDVGFNITLLYSNYPFRSIVYSRNLVPTHLMLRLRDHFEEIGNYPTYIHDLSEKSIENPFDYKLDLSRITFSCQRRNINNIILDDLLLEDKLNSLVLEYTKY